MLLMRSFEGLGPRRRLLWKVLRAFVPRETRWFYEGSPNLSGQLWLEERRLVFNSVRTYRPKNCFEIGTWKGGGTTYFIASAIARNGFGTLHTIETFAAFFEEAKRNYKQYHPDLESHIDFSLGDYRHVYPGIIKSVDSVDFVFLDGAEDANQTVEQYHFFSPFFRSGCVLMVHDWFTEKSRLIRPVLEKDSNWEIKTVLSPPQSVGLVLAIRK